MKRGDDLWALINSAQAEADKADHDHCYVGSHTWPSSGSLGTQYGAGGEITDRAVAAIQFAAVQSVIGHRANGGIGRGVITAEWTAEGLEVSWSFWTSAHDAFDALRKSA